MLNNVAFATSMNVISIAQFFL